MQHVIKNRKPTTYNIQFFKNVDRFSVLDSKGKVYLYRDVPSGVRSIKFNIPDKGEYYFSESATVKTEPLKIANGVYKIRLPKQERNREKDYFITHDDNLTHSPALIYTDTGMIVTGRQFSSLPKPMQEFIIQHEIGHFKYETEKYCDLYATVRMVKKGYSPSQAIYCLTDYLRYNPQNNERVQFVFDNMKNAGLIK